MSAAKEIRGKIKSVKNTRKITRAMEMVAASKMRKVQERMRASQAYALRIREVIGHVAQATPEYIPDYLITRDVRRAGLIIISTDRGLCGGLNANIFKQTMGMMESYREQKIPVKLCLIGAKAESFFRRLGGDVLAGISHLGDEPRVNDLIGPVKIMLDAYSVGEIDRLDIIHNTFVNTMVQRPQSLQLLPLPPSDDIERQDKWDYLYEPNAKMLLEALSERFIESQVYQSVVDNIACEQAARMVAMKAASDNAGEFIDELQLRYNKARQSAITQELSEIIAGASAI